MSHILVTGGAGYLGSTLVPTLLERGHHVTVLDDFRYDERSLLPCARHSAFRAVRGDARDERLVAELLKSADVVIPLAAIVGAPACDRAATDAVGINRDAVGLVCRLRSPAQRLLFPTTNSGYGTTSGTDFCTEETPQRPVSLYGRTKVEAEAMVLEQPNAVTFRLATVFGVSPRMRLDLLVNDFTYRALTDRSLVLYEPHFMRNYVSVRDVAALFAAAIERPEALLDGAYNFGLSSANLSKRELCHAIAKTVPNFHWVEAETGKDPDQRNYRVSNDKIERAGFRAEVSLEEGIRELVTAYRMLSANKYGNV